MWSSSLVKVQYVFWFDFTIIQRYIYSSSSSQKAKYKDMQDCNLKFGHQDLLILFIIIQYLLGYFISTFQRSTDYHCRRKLKTNSNCVNDCERARLQDCSFKNGATRISCSLFLIWASLCPADQTVKKYQNFTDIFVNIF